MGALVLTVLLAIVWVGCIGLGYWQGGWRQVVFLAGMLLSYAVLSEWAMPNGHDLSTQFHWGLARTTTGIALLYLIGGTLILGFLGGLVLERPRPLGARERQLGAAMGILNGGLFLALVLRTLRSYAYGTGGGRLLRTTAFARFFIESIGYVLLVALIVGLIAVGLGLALARRRRSVAAPDVERLSTQAIALQHQPRYEEPRPQPAPSPVSPELPARPPVREPVYTAEPIIDWPTAPPPGTLVEPVAAARMAPSAPVSEPQPETARAERPSPLPAQPVLPRRVSPPMRYPVAELVAAHSAPAPAATPLPADARAPAPSDTAPPAPAPEMPAPSAATPSVARPTSPPPGALHPAFVPPPVARQPQPDPPPVVRELDVATHDTAPVVREIDVATEDPPPVVRELDVTTQDEPIREEDAMQTAEPAPSLPAATPSATTETAPGADATAVPITAGRQEETAKPRAGFARIAVARQPGARAEQPPAQPPAPQPPPESDPLQPPLPTGPRVHACPTCGYPVRDHARYCPNCGSRQRL